MKKTFITFLFALFISPVYAATTDQQRETKGFGDTYQQALSSALLEAVRQVRGLEVGTEKTLKSTIIQSIDNSGSLTLGNDQISENIYTKSQGWIKTYEILEVIEPEKEGGQWAVQALVTVPVYKSAIKNDNRKTIAVLPFEISYKEIMAKNTRIVVDDLSERVSEGILSELTQSRKFAVVNRSYDKHFDKERALLKSNKVSSAEASRLGQKLGADFIIVGKIHSLSLENTEHNFYGLQKSSVDANVSLFYAVIEAATEKIMWADTVDYKYSGEDDTRIISEFIAGLSGSIVTNIMDVIYPVKILDLPGEDNILLNQGGKRLQVGLLMDVFTPGRILNDPGSGMPIKVDGQKIAQIKITGVLPKYSVATIVDGSFNQLKVNAITRRSKSVEQENTAPVRPLTPGSSDKPWNWN
ncbi:MAG: CsgG/HfaB family protein [Gammaproteobacteria bacterium]|nr:CsgG/HfaB family protein [Gammaproteobacteria bacterium]